MILKQATIGHELLDLHDLERVGLLLIAVFDLEFLSGNVLHVALHGIEV